MAHRLIRLPQHDRETSLGWLGVWWIETFVRHGRGGAQGMPVRYGDEYTGFIVDCYALEPDCSRRLYDSAFLSRPKGTDKSGIAAALVLFEAFGPARFAGIAKGGETYTFLGETYTYAPGEVMGKPVRNPVIKIMATEEGQTGNVYDTVYFNLTDEDAPLSAVRAAYGVDVGKTRVLLPSGSITPSTAGSASKDGGLETFAVFDETHLYTTDTLRSMYSTVTRNLIKRRKEGTWFIETTTMYEPGEDSIAEDTYFLADMIQEGKARRPRLLFDHRWAHVESLDKVMVDDETAPKGKRLETEDEYLTRLRNAFIESYGDAIAWNDPDGLLDSLFDTRQSESATRRYFFNALVEASNAWLKLTEWVQIGLKHRRAKAKAEGRRAGIMPPRRGDEIALGFDGSLNRDATVLIACRISDGYVFPIGIWEAPDSKEAEHWAVDHQAVEAVLKETFKKYKVVAFLADPPHWRDYVDRWENVYGPELTVRVSESKPISFETNRHAEMARVIERAETSIKTGEIIHGDHLALTRHVMNARRWKRPAGDVIGKDVRGSGKKMDAAVGMVLAIEGRARYRKEHKEAPTGVPRRVR